MASTTVIDADSTYDAPGDVGDVLFAGPNSKLIIHPMTSPRMHSPILGTVSGFVASDIIEIPGFVYQGLAYQPNGDGTGVLGVPFVGSIHLAGNYQGDHFTATPIAGSPYGYGIGVSAAPFDFRSVGVSDLLLQNDNGDLAIETMGSSGPTVSNVVNLGNPGADWNVVATAAFTFSGVPDVLVQNLNGQLVDYLMQGTSIKSNAYLANPGAGWHVRGTADFSYDGRADILLQNQADGNMVIWFTDGTSITGAVDLGSPGASWTIEGVGDFNGDGSPDILVQNIDGELVDYLMSGATILSAHDLGNPHMSVVGTADYNGDGKADILLHQPDGSTTIWDTDGTSITSVVDTASLGAGPSRIAAGADINGDHQADLVVQNNTTGAIAGYTLDNQAAITSATVLDTPDSSWHLITNNPIMFIDGTGSAADLTGTPGIDQFVLTSATAGLHTITGFDASQDVIALNAGAFPTYSNVQANEGSYQGGTYINLNGDQSAGVFIQGVTPTQLSAANFALK